MKKLRLILLALMTLGSLGPVVNAQPTVVNSDATTIDTGKYYYLRNRGRGMKYVNEQIDGYMALTSSISDYWITYIIRFEADGNNYKVKLWNDKYLTNTESSSQAVYAGDDAISVSASYTTANQWAFKNLTNNLYFNGNSNNFVYWGDTQDAGNGSYYVEETDLTDAQFAAAVSALKVVTFNITKLDGITTTTSTGFFLEGTTPVVPADAVENLADYTFTQDGNNYNFVASSQLSTDFANAKWYNMVIRSANNFVAYSATTEPYNVNKTASKAQLASPSYQWALIGDMTNGVKMVNKETGESYTLTANNGNAVLREGQTKWDIDVNNNTVTINDQVIKGFVLKVAGSTNNYINQNGGDGGSFKFWDSGNAKNDQGSTMFFVEAPELTIYNVTYNVKYNGKTVKTAVSAFEEGATLGSTIPAELEIPFVTLTPGWDAAQVVNADTEVDVNATWDGPVTLNADVANATWQNLAMRSTWYVTSGEKADDGALKSVNANALGLVEDAYQWAFVGDPYHIQLFNKAEQTKNFGFSAAAQVNQGIPGFQEEASYWTIKASTAITGAFVLNVYGTNLYINQFGGAGGSLKFWDNGANIGDAGSAFTIFDVPTNFAEYVTAEIAPTFEATGYFSLKEEVKTAAGWNASLKENATYEQYKALREKLLKLTIDDYIYPETGYYRIRSNYYEGEYIGLKATTLYGNYKAEADVQGAPTVVKLTRNGNQYSLQVQGKYIQAASISTPVGLSETNEVLFTPAVPIPGIVGFSADPTYENSYLHHRIPGQDDIVGWQIGAAASRFVVEDAKTITIPLSGTDGYTYATLDLPFGVVLPADADVEAYIVSTKGSRAQAKSIGKQIPAGTPVVLRANAKVTSVEATIDDAAQAVTTGNELLGNWTETNLGEDGLVLSISDQEGIGFYASQNNISLSNSAYLKAPAAGVNEIPLAFDDGEPTTVIYVKVASQGDIRSGVNYLIVNEAAQMAMGAIDETSNGKGVTISTSEGESVITAQPVNVLTLDGNDNGWTFVSNLANGYLNWTAGNTLGMASDLTSNGRWTITIDGDGNAVIANVADPTRVIGFNADNSNFAAYTEPAQQSVQLYMPISASRGPELEFLIAGTQKITLGEEKVADGYEFDEVSNDDIKDGIVVTYEGAIVNNTENHLSGFRATAKVTDSQGNVFTVKSRSNEDNVINVAQGLFGPNEEYEVVITPIVYYNYDATCSDIYTYWESKKAEKMIPDPKDDSWEFDERGVPTAIGSSMIPDPQWTLRAAAKEWNEEVMPSLIKVEDGPSAVNTDIILFEDCDPLPLYVDYNSVTVTIKTGADVQNNVKALSAQEFKAVDAWGNDFTAEFLSVNSGIATGVDKVNAATGADVIFNLAGQRVGKAVKGLYIQNGKKVVVK